MSDSVVSKVAAVVVCDFERAALGTRSRLGELLGEMAVIERVVRRLMGVPAIGEIVLLAPAEQMNHAALIRVSAMERVRVQALQRRPAAMDARVRIGRAWNLHAWRGGAGQWTFFDEEYHPGAIGEACASSFAGSGAEHVVVVHSHGVFLDGAMLAYLIHHHLHKSNEMRVSFTPAAPGLCGMVLRADIVMEMAQKQVMPWQLLAYDPKSPQFDTLIRDACMQVDPAISKVPNRFCVDTARAWEVGVELDREMKRRHQGGQAMSVAELCLAGARGPAPGVVASSQAFGWPREVEIELTGARLTSPPGAVPAAVRATRGVLDSSHWVRWFERMAELPSVCDDLLVTFGGDGDPFMFASLLDVLRAARRSGVLSIAVQTDLAGGDVDGLIASIHEGLVDVVSVSMYGHTAETYARVGGCSVETFGVVMKNMERLAGATRERGGVPLVVPRLLKVRETIPEMEAFFDQWIERCGWAVIDGPTDRAGAVPFSGVVDMAPPRRKACRRIWDRLVIRSDGVADACDQDVHGKLALGSIENRSIFQMWQALQELRDKHAAGRWNEIDPCKSCREWHRP